MAKPTTYTFYRPHKRVQFTGELVNHVTGELYRPPARTKQSFVKECDINNIIKQYSTTGQLSHIRQNAGMYVDLPDELDFQASLDLVHQGERAFASLPAKVRDRFGNDPSQFLAFMSDPANREEAIKLGLVVPARTPDPVVVRLEGGQAPVAPGAGGPPPADAPPEAGNKP